MYEFIFGAEGVLTAIIPIAIIGIAAAAAGVLGSGITNAGKGSKIQQMQTEVNKRQAENESWYNANAYSDYTQRADAQNMLKNLRDNLDRNRRQTTATAAITGATPAAVAAEKQSAANAVSDTYSNMAAMGQRWKDNITSQYINRKSYLDERMTGIDRLDLQRYDDMNKQFSNLTSAGINAASGGFGGFGGGGK